MAKHLQRYRYKEIIYAILHKIHKLGHWQSQSQKIKNQHRWTLENWLEQEVICATWDGTHKLGHWQGQSQITMNLQNSCHIHCGLRRTDWQFGTERRTSDVPALAWPESPGLAWLWAALALGNHEPGQKPKVGPGLAWLWLRLGLCHSNNA